ncbi:MAG: 4'-phosphopantetheinyl transferase superfamily protein [Bacteroidia bacterium]
MPLHSKEQLKHGIVALWEITESFDQLRLQVPESWLEGVNLLKLSKHNLAARALANTVCPGFKLLEKDEFGKPYFESAEYQISISHAGKYAAFMLHREGDCGIDMEKITDRIIPITSKFIREDEQAFAELGLRGMFMVWCAKEALYKLYGRKALDFKTHLKVHFQEMKESGILHGEINKGDYQKKVDLQYRFIEDYLIVHTL